ncbi:site-specific DNA-methyltransferase [Thorsellia kenyensis]|uniref:site-specific DNA-methyltransferase (adenine-specific) n=1 Tax=Thorsellia kenyensis TaxID=1549888 RepID=A0ABV6CA84_9GAMM
MVETIKKININELMPYAKNSRTHSEEQIKQIAKSIEEFGFTNPILTDGQNGIIAGHGRVLAAKQLGITEVPVIELSHLSDEQKRAYIIADNQLALKAGWDHDLLKAELLDLKLMNFDISLIGFSDDELGLLLFEDELETAGEDTEPESIQETYVSERGDVWIMGPHRLMCGDSTSLDDMASLMNNELADLWLTAPPYNVAYEGGTPEALTIMNDSMSDSDFRQFLVDCYTAADSAMKPGSSFYIWHADSEGYNFRGSAVDIGWKVRQCLIWNKNSMVMGRQDYHWKHEPCLYGWKEGASHNWYSDRKQTTVIEFDKPLRNGEHPTMKPVGLFEYQINNSSKKGDIILDSFGGSGTTLIACENLKRKARLMELDERYCDVIVKRWQTHKGKQAVLESSSKTYEQVSREREKEKAPRAETA